MEGSLKFISSDSFCLFPSVFYRYDLFLYVPIVTRFYRYRNKTRDYLNSQLPF